MCGLWPVCFRRCFFTSGRRSTGPWLQRLQWRWARPLPRGRQPDAQVCSVGTLKGLYLWTADGYTRLGGDLLPKSIMEGIRFNGDGTFTVPFGTVNIGGTIVIDISGGVGTYTVAADCTGTLSVTDGPSFSLYVGPGA